MKGSFFAVFAAGLVVSTATALSQPAPVPSNTTPLPPAGMQFESPFLRDLIPAIKQTGEPARVNLAAECVAESGSDAGLNGNTRLVYRRLSLNPMSEPLTGVEALRHLLQNVPRTVVGQDASGMVRITIGNVSTAILQTKISRLALSEGAQYTALSAVDELLNAPELIAAQRRTHVRLRNHLVDHLVGWGSGPHLSSSFQGVTIDQALDAIAQTFRGIVAYSICQMPDGSAWFSVRFVSE